MIMKSIKRMVVGIDFSIYSERGIEYAAWAAERDFAEIVAVSVINKRQIEHIKRICARTRTITLKKFLDTLPSLY
jgi:K+-sensing histidine kinase KdpD